MISTNVKRNVEITFILVDDSGEHQIGDDGGNTVEQSLVAEEEFASDDVQSPPEGDKTKLSLNEELGQLGVLNPPTPLSPDSKDSNASQKGNKMHIEQHCVINYSK